MREDSIANSKNVNEEDYATACQELLEKSKVVITQCKHRLWHDFAASYCRIYENSSKLARQKQLVKHTRQETRRKKAEKTIAENLSQVEKPNESIIVCKLHCIMNRSCTL